MLMSSTYTMIHISPEKSETCCRSILQHHSKNSTDHFEPGRVRDVVFVSSNISHNGCTKYLHNTRIILCVEPKLKDPHARSSGKTEKYNCAIAFRPATTPHSASCPPVNSILVLYNRAFHEGVSAPPTNVEQAVMNFSCSMVPL